MPIWATPVLEVHGLDAFYGQAQALWGVDLEVRGGEIVSVVGPNGAGKSTLVNAIAGLHRSVAGTIAMDGADLSRLPAHRVCDHAISIVPEGRRLFPGMTVVENLELGAYRQACRASRHERLEWVFALFPRLRERAGQPAGTLSGGERQKAYLAAALAQEADVLLLDEPSLGLAPVIVDELFDVMATINAAGVAVLLVEQNVERALAVAARAYLLIEGRVVLDGPAPALAGSSEVRRAVLGL